MNRVKFGHKATKCTVVKPLSTGCVKLNTDYISLVPRPRGSGDETMITSDYINQLTQKIDQKQEINLVCSLRFQVYSY